MSDLVLTETVDGVGIVSFNRPDRHNAISDALGREWREAVLRALDDRAVRCVLLCGEGPSFCSGRDTAELGQRSAGESDVQYVARAQEIQATPTPAVELVRDAPGAADDDGAGDDGDEPLADPVPLRPRSR